MVAALKQLGLRWFVAGSVASSIHGLARFTNDVDLLVDLDERAVDVLAELVGKSFYMDASEAKRAIRLGRAFNLIHLASAGKIDIFPLGQDEFSRSELARSVEADWAVPGAVPGESATRLVVASPEDTVLSKLRWYKLGGQTSDRQWGDILGVATRIELEWQYIRDWAPRLGVAELVDRLAAEVSAARPGT